LSERVLPFADALSFTAENVEKLSEFARKYDVPAMSTHIGVRLSLKCLVIVQLWVTYLGLVTPQYAYVLGASFGIPLLETTNRNYVVAHFQKWLESPSGKQEWKTLLKWAPTKIFDLVRDATKKTYATVELQNSIITGVCSQANQVWNHSIVT